MIGHLRRVLTAFAAVGICSATQAATWIDCQSCSMANAAEVAATAGPNQRVAIFQRYQKWALMFDTESRTVGGPNCQERGVAPDRGKLGTSSNCQLQTVAVPSQFFGDESTFNNALLNIAELTQGQMKGVLEIDGSRLGLGTGPVTGAPSGSAHDVLNSNLFRHDFLNQTELGLNTILNTLNLSALPLMAGNMGTPDPNGLLTSLSNVRNAIRHAGHVILGGGDIGELTLRITFSDGTTVIVMFKDGVLWSSSIEYRNADGQRLLSLDELQAEFPMMPNTRLVPTATGEEGVNFENGVRSRDGVILGEGGGSQFACGRTSSPSGEVVVTCVRL